MQQERISTLELPVYQIIDFREELNFNSPNDIYEGFRFTLPFVFPGAVIPSDINCDTFSFRFHKRNYEMGINHAFENVEFGISGEGKSVFMTRGKITLRIGLPYNESKHDKRLVNRLRKYFNRPDIKKRLFPYQDIYYFI